MIRKIARAALMLALLAWLVADTGRAGECPPIVISSVSPAVGPVSGGTNVTITNEGTGANFSGCPSFEPPPPTVKFGGIPAQFVSWDGGSQLVVKTPSHPPGTVDVTVEAIATSGTKTQAFTFIDSTGIPTLSTKMLACLGFSLVALASLRLR